MSHRFRGEKFSLLTLGFYLNLFCEGETFFLTNMKLFLTKHNTNGVPNKF